MNETLALLKLASKFLNPKDVRGFIKHVQVIKNTELNTVKFYASNGHIAIKISRKGTHFIDHINLPNQLTIDSITKAAKVNEISLLNMGNDEIKFPDYEKCFNAHDKYKMESVSFDGSYLALIFNAIETFRKDIKMTLSKITIESLNSDKAGLFSIVVNKDTTGEIKIDIAIMPLRS